MTKTTYNKEATERLAKLEAEYTHLYFAERNTEAEKQRMQEIDAEVKAIEAEYHIIEEYEAKEYIDGKGWVTLGKATTREEAREYIKGMYRVDVKTNRLCYDK